MREQRDHHCVMNVDGRLGVSSGFRMARWASLYDGVLQIADLNKIGLGRILRQCICVYAGEQARLRAQERREYTASRKAIDATQVRHDDTGESFCSRPPPTWRTRWSWSTWSSLTPTNSRRPPRKAHAMIDDRTKRVELHDQRSRGDDSPQSHHHPPLAGARRAARHSGAGGKRLVQAA